MGMSGARIGKKICRACSPTQKKLFRNFGAGIFLARAWLK